MDIDAILNELSPKVTVTLEDASNDFNKQTKQSESIADMVARFYKNATDAAVMMSKLKMLKDIKQLTAVSLEDVIGFMDLLKPANHPNKLVFSKDRSTSGLDALSASIALEEETIVNPLKATLEANALIIKDMLARYNSETDLFQHLYVSMQSIKTEATGIDLSTATGVTYRKTGVNPVDYPIGLLYFGLINGPDENTTVTLRQHFKTIKDEVTTYLDEVKHITNTDEPRAICVNDLVTMVTNDVVPKLVSRVKNEIHNLSLQFIEAAAIDTALDPATYYTVIYDKYNKIQHALLKEIKTLNVVITLIVPVLEIVKIYKKLTTPVQQQAEPPQS